MSKNFEKFRQRVGSLLFEDSYVTHGTIDNMRAGHIGDVPEVDEDSLDMPVDPSPQTSTQLSQERPPVEDPNYEPASTNQLAAALAALAEELPDETKVVKSTYNKFKDFVEDNKQVGIKIDDEGGNTSPKEVSEARSLVKNALLIKMLQEQVEDDLGDTDAYGNRYDDTLSGLSGPTDAELDAIENPEKAAKKVDMSKDETTLADLAKEMGLSTSGIKRLEAEALKKLRLMMIHFPDDMDAIKEMAMEYYAKGLKDLDLIDAEDAVDLMSSKDAYELPSFRQFMWDSFLNNVYKKMLRDADKMGLPEEKLGDLTPGLEDRAGEYFIGLPDSKKMKVLVNSLAVAE